MALLQPNNVSQQIRILEIRTNKSNQKIWNHPTMPSNYLPKVECQSFPDFPAYLLKKTLLIAQIFQGFWDSEVMTILSNLKRYHVSDDRCPKAWGLRLNLVYGGFSPTHLKNISQNGNLPQVVVKITNIFELPPPDAKSYHRIMSLRTYCTWKERNSGFLMVSHEKYPGYWSVNFPRSRNVMGFMKLFNTWLGKVFHPLQLYTLHNQGFFHCTCGIWSIHHTCPSTIRAIFFLTKKALQKEATTNIYSVLGHRVLY